jgi:hypothetical protein
MLMRSAPKTDPPTSSVPLELTIVSFPAPAAPSAALFAGDHGGSGANGVCPGESVCAPQQQGARAGAGQAIASDIEFTAPSTFVGSFPLCRD